MMTTTCIRGAALCVRSPIAAGREMNPAARLGYDGAICGVQRRRWRKQRESFIVRAEGDTEGLVNELLEKFIDKFEKAEDKKAVIGYSIGGLFAFLFVEWLIHQPLLDFILGFPLQTLGVLAGPFLLVRYVIDKEDVSDDVEMVVGKVIENLPGKS